MKEKLVNVGDTTGDAVLLEVAPGTSAVQPWGLEDQKVKSRLLVNLRLSCKCLWYSACHHVQICKLSPTFIIIFPGMHFLEETELHSSTCSLPKMQDL